MVWPDDLQDGVPQALGDLVTTITADNWGPGDRGVLSI
jgi:hypothetical protein